MRVSIISILRSTILAGLALITFGCNSSQPKVAGGSAVKPLRITVVTNNSSNWWTDSRLGGEEAARELPNVTLDFRLLSDSTAATQKRDVDDAIAAGADAIAVSPLDAVNQRQMLDEAASKVLLFTLDSDAPASNRACYVGTDDVDAGKMAGQLMAKALPHGGDIMVFVGKRDAQNAIDRLNGLKLGLQGSAVHIIDVRTDDADTTRAKANAADALVRYPNLAGMVGLWGYNGPAILSAAKDANKVGQIKIVAFDSDIATLQGIKQGQIYGTVVQQPYGFTKVAITRMVLYLRGDKNQIPSNKKVIFPTEVIDQSNVAPLIAAAQAH